MKNILILALSLLAFSLTSCEISNFNNVKEQAGSDIQVSEEKIENFIGSTEEVSYEPFVETVWFDMFYGNYLSPDDDWYCEGAEVSKPFKSVIVSETEVIAPLNVWIFPVVHEGEYIGFFEWDCRYPEEKAPLVHGGEEFAQELNDTLKKGNIAVFDTYEEGNFYGIYEDNTIINITGNQPYEGNLTFNEINQGYNLITADSVYDIIRTSDERLSEEEFDRQLAQFYEDNDWNLSKIR